MVPRYTNFLPIVQRPAPSPTSTNTPEPTATAIQTATPTPSPTITPTSRPEGWQTVYWEDFEGTFPGDWIVFDDDGAAAGEYFWAKRDCRKFSGRYSGWAVGGGAQGGRLRCGDNYPNIARSGMARGAFSLEGTRGATFSAKLWFTTDGSDDAVCLMAATPDIDWWGWCYYGNSQGWIDGYLDLRDVPNVGSLLGQPRIAVLLWFPTGRIGNLEEGAYVDDVLVQRYFAASSRAIDINGLDIKNIPTSTNRVPYMIPRSIAPLVP